MKKLLVPLLLIALSLPEAAKSVTRYASDSYSKMGVSLRLADETGSVYQAGEAVRFTAQADADAYLLVFDIDTDGFVHLLYPRKGESLRKFSAGEALTIPSQADESLIVTGKTGMEFVFAIAVPDRDAISEREIDWFQYDETQSADRRLRIDGDPLLAANRLAGRLVRGVSYAENVGVAFTYFFVNEAVDYPRYLCEDCYENDSDPYAPDRPWVATAALDDNEDLSYPLAAAFSMASEVGERSTPIGVSAPASSSDGVTNVYVSYYPSWGTGYYAGWGFGASYGYPYYGWGYYPYCYPSSGWYFSIGFNWGWGWSGWGYPYYCARPYYPYYSYGCYYPTPYYCGGSYYSVAYRSVRPHTPSRYKYKSDLRGTSTVAYRSKSGTGSYDVARYRSKSGDRYSPRSTYKGKGYSAYSGYKSDVRSVYRPRQTTYGKSMARRGYSDTKSIYRPRAKYNYPTRGKSYTRTRSTTRGYTSPRASRTYGSYESYSGNSRTRTFGSFGGGSKSFTKSRGFSSHSFKGYSRTRSYSGGRSKVRSR